MFKNAGWRTCLEQSETFTDLVPGQLDQLIAEATTVLKNDRTTTVVRIDAAADSWILKRYNARNVWHKLTRAIRSTRARRCWTMSEVFNRYGLAVPTRRFMLEKRVLGLNTNAYFANQFIQGETLLQYLPGAPPDQQQLIANAVLHAFTILEKHRLSHGDMKASNLIWANQKLYFIDLDAAKQHRHLGNWRRAHNKDRTRFLKNWRQHPQIMALFNSLAGR